jgi:hypothetical protein
VQPVANASDCISGCAISDAGAGQISLPGSIAACPIRYFSWPPRKRDTRGWPACSEPRHRWSGNTGTTRQLGIAKEVIVRSEGAQQLHPRASAVTKFRSPSGGCAASADTRAASAGIGIEVVRFISTSYQFPCRGTALCSGKHTGHTHGK